MIEMNNFIKRLIGLMFFPVDEKQYLFRNCRSVHSMFMREAIVVLGLDENMRVVEKEDLMPYRILSFSKSVTHILELKETSYEIGDIICVEN